MNRHHHIRSMLALITLGIVVFGTPSGTLATDPLPDGSILTDDGRVLPPMPDGMLQTSVHAEMLADEGSTAMSFEPGGDPTILLDGTGDPKMAGTSVEPAGTIAGATTALPNGLRKEVLGFLPYWMLTDSALSEMNYTLVSTIAYFSVGATGDGYLVKGSSTNPSTGWAGWTSSQMTQVIDRAHSNGVKVVPTVTMMGWTTTGATAQATLLSSGTYRARLASAIASAVKARGADGVNLDFEPVAASQRANFTTFVKQVKQALVSAGAGSYLTVDVSAGAATWATGWDVAGLTASGAADALFVMGYDYNWSGSARAGGVAPIQSPYTIDVDGTMNDFLSMTSGSKLIWGVPYYGRKWPTTSSVLNATTSGGASTAHYYTGHLAEAQQYGRKWDDVGKVPWYAYRRSDGVWFEGYYDDVTSLGIKYDLINARGFAGTGMWTLLMDQGTDDLWRLLADRFVNDTSAPVGGVTLLPASVDEQTVDVAWRAVDYVSGVNSYNVQVRRDGGSWATWLSATKATHATFSGDAGATYTFRVQAIDWKGNAQAWTDVPAKPANVTKGAFASVATDALNIRSGAGTGYAAVGSASTGDVVYVLDGPVSANGYQWYRVQYDFTEWPTADFANIGWVASGTSSEPYLVAADAPTRVKLAPFVTWSARTPAFSPNGDGVQDAASTTYSLSGAATVRLDVVGASGTLVRSQLVGSQAAGTRSAAWDGRTASGAIAPAGSYLLRIVATDADGGVHVAPSSTVSSAVLAQYGVVLDLTRPTASASPAQGTAMVAASTLPRVTFSEPVSGVSGSSLQLTSGGSVLSASVTYDAAARRATLDPTAPLPTGATVAIVVRGGIRDAAGNAVGTGSTTFGTAPGIAYAPFRTTAFLAGRYTGWVVGADGRLSSPKTFSLGRTSSAPAGQRATLPNLPGRWLHIEAGIWAGRWDRESTGAHLFGEAERVSLPTGTSVGFSAGTHVGYTFDARGNVTGTRSYRLTKSSAAGSDARAIINGAPYLRIVNGVWAGYWLPESTSVYVPGFLDRMAFASNPGIRFAAGTYTGYLYNSLGHRYASRTYTLSHSSSASAVGWAVINGVPHTHVLNGIWAGYWVPESPAATVAY